MGFGDEHLCRADKKKLIKISQSILDFMNRISLNRMSGLNNKKKFLLHRKNLIFRHA